MNRSRPRSRNPHPSPSNRPVNLRRRSASDPNGTASGFSGSPCAKASAWSCTVPLPHPVPVGPLDGILGGQRGGIRGRPHGFPRAGHRVLLRPGGR
ncbi:MAG: hypothetical protein MZU97_12255 [Bacillus subtilis]|nr:hypothetical protein [Bacillus subtilis]